MRVGCVVMASGESVRFGGNKLLAPFQGKPLIVHALEKLPEALDSVAVVTRSAEVSQIAAAAGHQSILHTLPHRADTIRLGLERMAGMDACLFLVADQPLCRKETLIRMMQAAQAHAGCIVRAHFAGRWGNPVLFPAAMFGALMCLAPGQSGSAVIAQHRDCVVPLEVADALELVDVDTKEQLLALERLGKQD